MESSRDPMTASTTIKRKRHAGHRWALHSCALERCDGRGYYEVDGEPTERICACPAGAVRVTIDSGDTVEVEWPACDRCGARPAVPGRVACDTCAPPTEAAKAPSPAPSGRPDPYMTQTRRHSAETTEQVNSTTEM